MLSAVMQGGRDSDEQIRGMGRFAILVVQRSSAMQTTGSKPRMLVSGCMARLLNPNGSNTRYLPPSRTHRG